MEDCQKLGLTKSIGVCNFSCKKIETLLATAKIPPAVNQVEMNPVWRQKKLRELCKRKGIIVTAYSPLGGKGTYTLGIKRGNGMWKSSNRLQMQKENLLLRFV